jgi:hypothetical protein
MEECHKDVQALCPEVNSDEAAHECIKTHWEELSVECRTAVEEFLKTRDHGISGNGFDSEHKTTDDGFARNGDSDSGMADVHKVDTPMPMWQFWLQRLWWTYPVGLVFIIQTVAFFRIRNIRRIEASQA